MRNALYDNSHKCGYLFGYLDKFYGAMPVSSAISSNNNYNSCNVFGKWNGFSFKLCINGNLYFYTNRING